MTHIDRSDYVDICFDNRMFPMFKQILDNVGPLGKYSVVDLAAGEDGHFVKLSVTVAAVEFICEQMNNHADQMMLLDGQDAAAQMMYAISEDLQRQLITKYRPDLEGENVTLMSVKEQDGKRHITVFVENEN